MNAVLIDEQLEAAYRVVAHHSWPDLHELKLAAARYKLVEGYAMRRASFSVRIPRCACSTEASTH